MSGTTSSSETKQNIYNCKHDTTDDIPSFSKAQRFFAANSR